MRGEPGEAKAVGISQKLEASRSPPNGQRTQGHFSLTRKNKLFHVVFGPSFPEIYGLLFRRYRLLIGWCFSAFVLGPGVSSQLRGTVRVQLFWGTGDRARGRRCAEEPAGTEKSGEPQTRCWRRCGETASGWGTILFLSASAAAPRLILQAAS